MPAATCHAPGSPASTIAVRRPRAAARHAIARPIGPAPATATSSSWCGWVMRCLPTPALPGSGSTVGAQAAPSQPVAGSRRTRSIVAPGAPARLSRVTLRERLSGARLYLVCDARPRAFLDAALRGGVDVIQLRDKTLAGDAEIVAAARAFRAAADDAGALFVLND